MKKLLLLITLPLLLSTTLISSILLTQKTHLHTLSEAETKSQISDLEDWFENLTREEQKDVIHNVEYLKGLVEIAKGAKNGGINKPDYQDKGHKKFEEAIARAEKFQGKDYIEYRKEITALKKSIFDFYKENATNYDELNITIKQAMDNLKNKPNKQGKSNLHKETLKALEITNDASKTQKIADETDSALKAALTKFETDNKAYFDLIQKEVDLRTEKYNSLTGNLNHLETEFKDKYDAAKKIADAKSEEEQAKIDQAERALKTAWFNLFVDSIKKRQELFDTIEQAYKLYNHSINMNGTEELIIAIEQAEKVAYNKLSTSEQFKNEIATLTKQIETFKEANKTTTVELEKTISEAKQVQFNDPELNKHLAKVIADAETIVKKVGEANETNLGPNQLEIDFTNKQLKYLMLNLPAMDQVTDIILKNNNIIAKKGQLFTIEIINNDLLWDKEYKITKGVDLVQEFYFSQNLGTIDFYAKEAGEVQIELSALNAKNKTIVNISIKDSIPLKNEEFKFKEILYSDMTKQTTKEELQSKITQSEILNSVEIKMGSVNETKLDNNVIVYTQEVIFFNKNDNKDKLTLIDYWYDANQTIADDITIYIDNTKNAKTHKITKQENAPSDAKVILKIGFTNSGETYQKFKGDIVTTVLPQQIKSLKGFFQENLTKVDIVGIKFWDVSNVVDMEDLFYSANNLNPDVRNWNVSNVTSLYSTFHYTKFNYNIGHWNVSKVTNMQSTFNNNSVFNQDISTWDTSNVTTMKWIFQDAKAMDKDNNCDLSGWNVEKVNSTTAQFANRSPLGEHTNHLPKFKK